MVEEKYSDTPKYSFVPLIVSVQDITFIIKFIINLRPWLHIQWTDSK